MNKYKYCPSFSNEVSYLQNNQIFRYLGEESIQRTIGNQEGNYGKVERMNPGMQVGVLWGSHVVQHQTLC